MSLFQVTPAKLIEKDLKKVDSYLDDFCTCGCKRMDHRLGPKLDKLKRGACRMCSNCRRFKTPKPIKSKIKKVK
jgi:hypothetical protein